METTSLDDVLNGNAQPTPAPAPAASTPAPAPAERTEPSGEIAQTTGDTPATPAGEQDDPTDKRAKGLIAAATAEREKRQAAERRVQELMEQLQGKQQPTATPAPSAPAQDASDPKPTRADFASEDEWLDARDEWRDRQKDRETQQQAKQKAEADFQAKTVDALTQAAQMPGFDMDLFKSTPISPVTAEAIVDSDVAGKLIHHLVTNPEDARRIAALSPARQIKEIARIEDRLSQSAGDDGDEDDDAPNKRATPREFPKSLTQERDARGQFKKPGFDGPTPLNAILK